MCESVTITRTKMPLHQSHFVGVMYSAEAQTL